MTTLRSKRLRVALIRPWFIVTLACVLYIIALIAANDNDPLALVTIGSDFAPVDLYDSAFSEEGYDGQFVYYIARDPNTAERYLDVPAYRFQRILLPFVGIVLSFGQESLIPYALMLVNLIALAGGTALMEHLLVQQKASRWYALGYGFALGVFGSARLALPETLAYALVLAGIIYAQRENWLYAAILFALAGLAKETAFVFAGGYGLYLLFNRKWREAIWFGLIAGIPFILWQFILRSTLGEFGVGSGGDGATGFEIIPFGGILRILTDSVTLEFTALPYGDLLFIPAERIFFPPLFLVFGIFIVMLMPFAIYPTLWGLRECWIAFRENRMTAIVFLLLANACLMLFVPFSTYREPLGILRFVVGLQIAVMLFAAEKPSRRALLNSTIWGYTGLLMVGWDFAG